MSRLRTSPAFIFALAVTAAAGGYLYPPSKIDPVSDDYFGTKITDNYRWLEDTTSGATQRWMARQTAVTRAVLDALPGRDSLRREFTALYNLPSFSTPSLYGDRYFNTRREGGQNHAVLFMRDGSFAAEARTVIDPNTFSADGTVALDWWTPSPDGSLLVYGKSVAGNEISTLFEINTDTGEAVDTTIPFTRYSSIAWLPDNSGFYYAKYPFPGTVAPGDENYYRHIFFHASGDANSDDDPLVFGDGLDKETWINSTATSDYEHLILTTSLDWIRNDLFIRPLAAPADSAEFIPIAIGLDGTFDGDTYNGTLYLLTSYNAPRNRIIAVDLERPEESNWREIIPQQPGVISEFKIVGGKLAVEITTDAVSHLFVYSLDGRMEREISMPTLGSIGGLNGRPDRYELFFSFQSFAYPPANFRFDLRSDKLEIVESTPVNFDLAQYQTQQVFYHSLDGTRVPMFIVSKKGMKRDRHNPTLLTGYGGFGISISPGFGRSLFPWLDRGGVYAVANLRGGNEYGREWHEAGRLGNKQNVFDDFIAASDYLIGERYTLPKHLAIDGGSNGGLLVGAALTQRPDQFSAVVCAVPLLDMLRYHKFEIARLWIPEYGSSEDPGQFEYLEAYSPYQHVVDGVNYPAVLLMTGEEDSRVAPLHAMKMAARLQAANSGPNPILIRIEPKAGHGVGKPVSKIIDSEVDKWSFLFWRFGIRD